MAFVKFNPNRFTPDPKSTPKVKEAKPIKKVSVKLKKHNLTYTPLRKKFLSQKENQWCFIEGCGKMANTVEHTKGRQGYADEWAKENKIPLLLDVRFWKPCCLKHNLELESNHKLSKQYQLSKLHPGKKI